ncbi:MAG: M20 family metallopeptidase [Sedimentibacter sp.]|uniref:M20 family metallopeptidase n=1 Tax=Sedimentibacter sp. TaxID=1960295 RepID=UPI00315884AA
MSMAVTDLLFENIEKNKEEMFKAADYIFDNPESDCKEEKAAAVLTNILEEHGFVVEKGVGKLKTAFRAVYESGRNGPSIGLLCEYDALEGIGHACGHHMQGPAIIYAAIALKEKYQEKPFKIVVYGTPAEESTGGKIIMLENGCFRDIEVALMFHGGPATTTDVKSMALSHFKVKFTGKSSHAAMQPEYGRSAFDAMLLSFNAIEFLREHVAEDTRMHYTVTSAGGPDNIVPKEATSTYTLRSYNRSYLDDVVERFKDIIKGAALMTGTTYEIKEDRAFDNKIPVMKLNQLLMNNARMLNAPSISPPREKTGSTDFGNVMYNIPGSCIRVAFVPENTSAHSQEYLDAGKSEKAHEAMLLASKILAGTCYDIINDENLLREIKKEFEETKQYMSLKK